MGITSITDENTVALGACITIMAIGVDLCMQQVIEFGLQPHLFGNGWGNSDGNATSVWEPRLIMPAHYEERVSTVVQESRTGNLN